MTTLQQEAFLRRAAAIAMKSPHKQHRHGCVIVRGDEIVSEGFNHNFVHLYHKHSIHAEVDALNKTKHNRGFLKQCDMYVVRIGTVSQGYPLKLSKPCQDCTKAILRSGIRRVFYSEGEMPMQPGRTLPGHGHSSSNKYE
jgi:deoxycytidylate deaminase